MRQSELFFQTADMAEKEPQLSASSNTVEAENVEMIGNTKHSDTIHIAKVRGIHKAVLPCSQRREKDTLANNGNAGFNGTKIMFLNCGKQYSGEKVVSMTDSRLGLEWINADCGGQTKEVKAVNVPMWAQQHCKYVMEKRSAYQAIQRKKP